MQHKRFTPFLLMLLCSLSAIAFGQGFRGALTGTVTDPTGAAIAGAKLKLIDVTTNATLSTETNGEGVYSILYVLPGRHKLVIEANGFRARTHENIEVRVGDQLTLNLSLEVGQAADSVVVTGDSTPLLESATASRGQVIDRRRIEDLPLPDGNPFTLARLASGVAFTDTGALRFTRAFDNGGTSNISTNGAGSQANEFTLDGVPNNGAFGRQVAYVPPAEAVQEFKVVTSSFDAAQGHSAGAQIDVTLRSGGNRFFGSLYEFNRNEALAANEFFVNSVPTCAKDENDKCKRSPLRYNRYGGTVGGPVFLPRFGQGGPTLWNGKDRLFFFFAYEGLRQITPATNFYTVPTQAMRNGDFSSLLPTTVIYDPATAFLRTDGRVERRPFAGNIIPAARISPIARNFLSYWPLQNLPCANAQCRNNLIAPSPRTDYFHSESARFDAVLTEKQRMFFRYSHNKRRQNTEGFSGVVNGVDATSSNTFRINHGAALDHVYTMSASTILNLRAGLTRFESINSRVAEGTFNAAQLGFPSSTLALFRETDYFPQFDITNFNPNTGGGTFGAPLSGYVPYDVYSFQPTLTKILGGHNLRTGYDFRSYRINEHPARHEAGLYIFDAAQVTTRQFSNSAAAPIGQELAALLLGLPTGGRVNRNATRNNQALYHGLFVQDDWKVTKRLTLNLGLRWDMETPTTERYNRNIRGFDLTSSNPIEAAARAAYTANPIPQVAASAFQVRGGYLFADANNRGFFEADKNNFQPRIGFAYQVNQKTVVRGGFAVYSAPFYLDGVNQSGFSNSTNLVPTQDAGLTFDATLANPFPTGVLGVPGAADGLRTFIGQSLSFVPLQRNTQMARRYELSLQRELPGRVVADLAFVHSTNYNVRIGSVDLNPVPRQYLTTLNQRDSTVDNFLTALVPNPFRGLLPNSNFNGTTIERQQLLRPFPHLAGLSGERYDGESYYNSLQLRLERRFAQGYTLNMSYTFSKLMEELSLLNPTDTTFERRISRDDFPHRVVLSGIYELPFGKGRRWLSNSRVIDLLIGGAQFQGIYQYQSGRPFNWGNVAYYGNPSSLSATTNSSTVGAANRVFDINGFLAPSSAVDIRLRNNVRTFPTRLSGLRSHPISQLDLSVIKNFNLTERTRLQLRGEFLNATNTPQFGEPNLDPTNANFGRVTSQVNLARNIQIGLRLTF